MLSGLSLCRRVIGALLAKKGGFCIYLKAFKSGGDLNRILPLKYRCLDESTGWTVALPSRGFMITSINRTRRG